MRNFILIAILCLCTFSGFTQSDKYYRISVLDVDKSIDKFHKSDLSLEYHVSQNRLLLEVSDAELEQLDKLGIKYNIEIADLEDYYQRRNQGTDANSILELYRNNDAYTVPQDFSLGSMGGFCTLDEMLAHLDTMFVKYPNLISQRQPLDGQSIQGKSIFWMRISDNPNINESEPEIFFNSLIHAREPASMQQMLYFMYFLLENYESDPEIKKLVDNSEIYFVPCINPDGYVNNQQTHPAGGGMWRKNRRVNFDGSFGVDINRNFSYNWGWDDYGSSPNTLSSTYRGEAPFSEPETQIVKNFVEDHDFKLVINYHSYSNVLVHPWGYVSYLKPDDYNQMTEMASLLTIDNQFNYGATSRLLYHVNGDANDWIYGENVSKPSCISFTAEVGSEAEGFWPPIENIIPQCQSCLEMNILAVQLAGFYARISDEGPAFISEREGYFPFSFLRNGLTDSPFMLSLYPIGESFQSLQLDKQIASTPQLEKVFDSVYYQLNPAVKPGDRLEYVIKIENESFTLLDTITKIFGQEHALLDDPFNDLTNWETSDWYLRDNQVYSPAHALANVSDNYYANNIETFVYLKDTIVLDEAMDMWVNFKAKWDLDGGKDYVKFLVSMDYGQSWQAFGGRYTGLISDGQQYIPVYQSEVNQWLDEWVFVPDIYQVPLMFGFSFKSDGAIGRSGFYCDDFRVLISNRVLLEQSIQIPAGWSGVSSFLFPEQTELDEVFGTHFSSLEFMTDNIQFYQAENSNSTLDSWNSENAYLLKSSENFTLNISGYPDGNKSLMLYQGWNLIPVTTNLELSVENLSTDPPGLILSIKDACGLSVYWPDQGVSTLHELIPGKSYFVNMAADGLLIVE